MRITYKTLSFINRLANMILFCIYRCLNSPFRVCLSKISFLEDITLKICSFFLYLCVYRLSLSLFLDTLLLFRILFFFIQVSVPYSYLHSSFLLLFVSHEHFYSVFLSNILDKTTYVIKTQNYAESVYRSSFRVSVLQ